MRSTAPFALAGLFLLFTMAPVAVQAQPQESADLKAYRAIYDKTIPDDKKVALAEAFFADTSAAFIDSRYRNDVYMIQFNSYAQLKNWPRLLDTLDRLEKLAPTTAPAMKLQYYQGGMTVANELKDVKKITEYAEKVIVLDPANLPALLALTNIPDGAREPELNKAVGYAKRILDLQKPETVSEAQWQSIRNALEIQNKAIEALMVFDKKDYVGCVKAYEDLIKLTPKDAAAHYRMGICEYYEVRRANEVAVAARDDYRKFLLECNKELLCESEENKAEIEKLRTKDEQVAKNFDDLRAKAIEAFARAVAIGGSGEEITAARTELERLYKTKAKPDTANPLEGLDELIAQKKKELGE